MIHLLPQGPKIMGRDGRVFTLTNPNDVLSAFHDLGMKLPIDLEHATEIKGKKGEPAPAVGWVIGLEARDDGIWGKVEWNPRGREMIEDKSYRYLSPVFTKSKDDTIGALISVGLTNQPNLNLTALNSAQSFNPKETKKMDKELLEALGLGDGATTEDALGAINALQEEKTVALNRAENPDLQKFAPRAEINALQTELQKYKEAEVARNQVEIEGAVDQAIEDGKITPANRGFYIASCQSQGVDAFNSMIKSAPALAGESNFKAPDGAQKTNELSDAEIAVNRALGIKMTQSKD